MANALEKFSLGYHDPLITFTLTDNYKLLVVIDLDGREAEFEVQNLDGLLAFLQKVAKLAEEPVWDRRGSEARIVAAIDDAYVIKMEHNDEEKGFLAFDGSLMSDGMRMASFRSRADARAFLQYHGWVKRC